MSHQITRSMGLSLVPERKLNDILLQVILNCKECSKKKDVGLDRNLCNICRLNHTRIRRYADANIPALYWLLEMEKNFVGDQILKDTYEEITKDLKKSYFDGVRICFAGSNGVGKSMTLCNILKRAAEKNFSALYVNLNDIISVMLSRDSDDKSTARRELLMVDFLVIDEFDQRYMPNDKSADLFGKILEEVFRCRAQNKLPILMSTNTIDIVAAFYGTAMQGSIDSLMSTVDIIPVLGQDQRKKGQK